MQTFIIREEVSEDIDRIAKVTREAFASHPRSKQTEHFIINELRRANAMSVSLVAEVTGIVVGHIAFSPVRISDGSSDWYGLGPVSVFPAFQRQGIGQELVKSGLEALRKKGAKGCVVFGSPLFYGRFGFVCNPNMWLLDVPQEFFQSLQFGVERAQGEVTYHAAFSAEC
jgi:putative acetyltransferase